MIVSFPLNEQELRDMMYSASTYEETAWAIRYPRGRATGMKIRKAFSSIEPGIGECLREGDEIGILSFGPIGNYVIEVADSLEQEGIAIGHYNMRFAKPLDTELVDEAAGEYQHLITIEDGTRLGGFVSAVVEYLSDKPEHVPTSIMGAPDRVVEHGTQRKLHDEIGIGPEGVIRRVKSLLKVYNDIQLRR